MELNWTQLTLFLYITARMSGFVLFNPLLGRKSLPGLFRAGLILSLSVFVFPLAQQQTTLADGVIALALRLLLELALGFVLGMVINFFFYIPQLAGLVIDTQMGMTMNEIYDAGAQANMSVTGQFLNVLMTLLFFAANGHHTLLRIMASSGQIVPFGAVSFGPEVSSAVLSLFVECTVLAVKLCMPILAAELLGQIGMGILMKAIPQINVFSINIELKVLIGLALLFILIAPFSEFLLDAEMMMLDSLEAVLKLTG